MVKKAKTRLKTEKTCKKLEAQIQEKTRIFLRNLQGVLKKSCDLNDSDGALLRTRNTRKSSLRKDSAFSHTSIRNEDTTRDNYMCYRCRHFLEIPRNLSQPFSDGVSTFVERCKNELSFIQAIVWLKSSITCASQIPVKQLQRIFNEQWSTCSEYNHSEDEHIDVEQLGSSMDKDLPIYERTRTRDTITTSTPLNISNVPQCVTSQRIILSTRSEDPRNESLNSMSVNDPNESIESSILGSSSSRYIAQKEKKKEIRFYIIPKTDVESILDEDIDIFDNIPESQLSFEKDMERSVQNTSKNDFGQIKNKKIIENRHIFQKSQVDEPSEHEYILSARNQSIDQMFEYNYNEKRFILTKNQNALADKVLEFDGSPKNFIITPKISQISNVCNEYFELLLNDNSSWQASNTAVGNLNDSAYSTSHIDIFNCDTVVETVPVTGNKRVPEHYYELQSCKKKTIAYKKGKVSFSTNEMLTFDGSPRSLTITQKDMSQISNVYNDENSVFQITSSCDERISNMSSENLKDGAAVTTESIIGNKRIRNIEHYYKSNPRNEKTVTRQKMASPSIIQRAVIPHTNIEHCYNLQASNNKKISREKKDPSAIMQEPEKYKSGAWNLSEEEDENEDEMISANWLNFTMESLRVECVILASIKVILSTLCDKRTTEEYMLRQQRRNMRNYWKDSLEEAAVNAVLNISDIFIIEKKPNICIKIIMTAIVKTLNEMTMYGQLYKIYNTQTSVWIYRVQIILEFCNSLPICVKITDYLIMKLKLLQSSLTNVKKIQKYNCVLIKQLHLVFYALNITLRKYCTIISSDQRSRPVEKMIPYVADLWKTHYIDKELQHTDLNLDVVEKQWLNTLENGAITFADFELTKFAEKSFSLIHVLISQSSAKIT